MSPEPLTPKILCNKEQSQNQGKTSSEWNHLVDLLHIQGPGGTAKNGSEAPGQLSAGRWPAGGHSGHPGGRMSGHEQGCAECSSWRASLCKTWKGVSVEEFGDLRMLLYSQLRDHKARFRVEV